LINHCVSEQTVQHRVSIRPWSASMVSALFVERQPPCPRATTILAGFEAAEVGVSFNVSG